VYGNPKYTPMDIEHPLYPRSVYAVTKLASEKHCRAIYEWYSYPVVIIRNFNTFGENQNIWGYTAVIPMFIHRALRGEPIEIHGDGSQTRDFMYVKNAVAAYEEVISRARELSGGIFNIGSGQQLAIRDLAAQVIEMTGSASELVNKPSRLADIFALHADIEETLSVLQWQPSYTFEQGLERTIAWYRKFEA
jgi:nucleoside-diphosphate-sugar epimerase